MQSGILTEYVEKAAPLPSASAAPARSAGRAPVLRRWWRDHRAAIVESLVLLLSLRVVLSLVAALAIALLPEQRGQHEVFHRSANTWLDVWARWDSEYYLDIAQHGYALQDELVVFFPLYPLLVAAVGGLLHGHYLLAGVLVSQVAALVALIFLFELARLEFGEHLAGRTVLYLAAYPTAFFLLAVYSEAVFLALTVAAFYFARRRQWAAAALAAFCAALTRPNGIVLTFPLAYEAWRQAGGTLRSPWRGLPPRALGGWLAVMAAPLGMAVFAAYLGWLTGDPLSFVHRVGIPPWERFSSTPWGTLAATLQLLGEPDLTRMVRASNTIDLAFAVLLIEASLIAWWRLPPTYAIYLTCSTALLLSSTVASFPMQSLPRYSLVVFPLFFLLAQLGASHHWHRVILLVSAPLLGLFTALFATWYWVF